MRFVYQAMPLSSFVPSCRVPLGHVSSSAKYSHNGCDEGQCHRDFATQRATADFWRRAAGVAEQRRQKEAESWAESWGIYLDRFRESGVLRELLLYL